MEMTDYEVVIIGGGPAGLAAGLYLTRAQLKTLLIEQLGIGGQVLLTDRIENYPGFPEGIRGYELIDKFKKQTEKFGLEFAFSEVKKIEKIDFRRWKIITSQKQYITFGIIIATGAKPKKLNVPGEDRFRGKGISYCATCDGMLFKDKDVIVVGGGDTAVEEALFLAKFVKKITLVHRRDRLRATKILQDRIFSNNKIEFVWNSQIVEILGDEKVKAVKVKNIKTQKGQEIPCDGVFVFIGFIPNTDFLKGMIEMDANGYIITDENMKTSEEGIFACGDGATAAFACQQYVEELKGIAYK